MKTKQYFLMLVAFAFGMFVPLHLYSQQVSTPVGTDMGQLDSEMQVTTQVKGKTLWVNAKDLCIEGMGWDSGIGDYKRLPEKYKETVTSKVWTLSRHSAGIAVKFTVANTSFIRAKWTLTENKYMAHMTPQATNGLDLYIKQNGKWVWTAIAKPKKEGLEQEVVLKKSGLFSEDTYECILYLPLYSGVRSLELGFSKDASVAPAAKSTKKPIVMYGTSIMHGCSASRTGMAFPAMIGRHFDIPVVNLGFSGNGLMEEYFGDILNEIPASAYVIDCLPNMWRLPKGEITHRVLTLVRKIRTEQPTVPIVLVEDRTNTSPNFSKNPTRFLHREGQQEAYKQLKKEFKNLYYIEGEDILQGNTETTVDGSHPSDLGMYFYYLVLQPVLEKALK